MQNFNIDTSIKLPRKEILQQQTIQQPISDQVTNKPKLSYEELKQKYGLQDFYIDTSIKLPQKKRKIKPNFSLKELIKNKQV